MSIPCGSCSPASVQEIPPSRWTPIEAGVAVEHLVTGEEEDARAVGVHVRAIHVVGEAALPVRCQNFHAKLCQDFFVPTVGICRHEKVLGQKLSKFWARFAAYATRCRRNSRRRMSRNSVFRGRECSSSNNANLASAVASHSRATIAPPNRA